MSYESERLVSDAGPSSGQSSTEDRDWRSIRELSVLGFARKVARVMGVAATESDEYRMPDVRRLMSDLTSSALRDGEDVRFRGATYTPAMQLELYRRREDRA
jgi:hypothetical protein